VIAGQETTARSWSDEGIRSFYFRYSEETGSSDRDVVDRIVEETGISRKRVYAIVVEAFSADP